MEETTGATGATRPVVDMASIVDHDNGTSLKVLTVPASTLLEDINTAYLDAFNRATRVAVDVESIAKSIVSVKEDGTPVTAPTLKEEVKKAEADAAVQTRVTSRAVDMASIVEDGDDASLTVPATLLEDINEAYLRAFNRAKRPADEESVVEDHDIPAAVPALEKDDGEKEGAVLQTSATSAIEDEDDDIPATVPALEEDDGEKEGAVLQTSATSAVENEDDDDDEEEDFDDVEDFDDDEDYEDYDDDEDYEDLEDYEDDDYDDVPTLGEKVDAALKNLECPFTWDTPPMQSHQIEDILVKNKGRMPMIWNEVIIMAKLAYTFCQKNQPLRGFHCLVEAYMRLLPAFDEGDELVRDYYEALKHLVDATWAHMCRLSSLTSEYPDESLRDLAALVDGLTPGKSLRPSQRSALLIVRAKCAHYPDSVPLAREAIEMWPDEGHWHTVLAKLLCSGRYMQKQLGEVYSLYSQLEQKKAAMAGFEKRKTVEAYLMLASVHQDTGFCSKAMEIMKEAVEAFPRSSWVLVEAAEMARALPKPQRDTRSALRWLRRALECPGGSCPYVSYLLGVLLLERGDNIEARPHIARAAPQMEEAKELLNVLNSMGARSASPWQFVRSSSASSRLLDGMRSLGFSVFRVDGGATIPGRSGRKRF
ncbi:uncharacterized protein LOC113211622 [Frankliniella occidentalis]|uniref:Uncharacterized protein LOC113211622 n=1 Tax=Frankliniella occidentalis TaxID=133901 RepID=A0A6J1SX81_FRAOC|nr:uncharacterized protein LOC113211622 [Frankliniella occidentalis]